MCVSTGLSKKATCLRGRVAEIINFGHKATVVDNGRHQQKLIKATRPRRHAAFLDKPCIYKQFKLFYNRASYVFSLWCDVMGTILSR